MAAEGGGFKPGDFFVGVVELFAIFVPGAILTYIIWRLDLQCLIKDSPAPFSNLTPPAGVAGLTFAVMSYVVGHLLAAIGWIFMDTLFEAHKNLFPSLQGLEDRVRKVVAESAKPKEKADVFSLALAYIDTQNPPAAGKLEAIEADCKFCRNLIPTLFLTLPIIDVACYGWFSCTKLETFLTVCFFVYFLVASISFRQAESAQQAGSALPAEEPPQARWIRLGITSLRRLFTPTPPAGDQKGKAPPICFGITSLLWLFVLLVIPVLANIGLAWHRCARHDYFWIDIGILMAALLAMVRYTLLQLKRMSTAYEYLLAVRSVPKSA